MRSKGRAGGKKGKSKNENVESNICVTFSFSIHMAFTISMFCVPFLCMLCIYFSKSKSWKFYIFFFIIFCCFHFSISSSFFGCLNFHHQGFVHAFGEFWLVLLWGNWKFLNMVRIMVVYYHFSQNKWLQLVTDT